MPAVNPHFVVSRKHTFGGLLQSRPGATVVNMTSDVPQYAEIGHRLRAIRTGFSDLSQKAWAEKHGFNQTQYNNWELGTRRIAFEAAERLCDLYGLSLDFVYRGRRDALSEMASKVL